MDKIEKSRIVDILSMSFSAIISEIRIDVGQKYKNRYKSAIHKRNKSHPFIPYTPKVAVEQLLIAFDLLANGKPWNVHSKKKFLDAGCGIGNIMLLAQKVGFVPYGLEIDPTLIKAAKKVDRQISHHIVRQNIMTYKKYDEYDVIYYFCPFDCHEKEQKFEKRVEDQMKIGAILIPNYKQCDRIMRDKRFRVISNSKSSSRFMYVKKSK